MFPLSQFLHRKIIYLFVHQASTQECNTSPVSMQAFSSSHSSFPTISNRYLSPPNTVSSPLLISFENERPTRILSPGHANIFGA